MIQESIDINADLGEGAGFDVDLIALVTSANVACGAHGGDESTMRATVALALRQGVQIGAHPGLSDREFFGRREMPVAPREAAIQVLAQVSSLRRIAREAGSRVMYMKLHGALYTMAARDRELAAAIAQAVWTVDRELAVVTQSGSCLDKACCLLGLEVVSEMFADRTYQPDGLLTPRSRPDALITDDDQAVEQVLRVVKEGRVRATDGSDVKIHADTICLHGDQPNAARLCRRLRAELGRAGVAVRAF